MYFLVYTPLYSVDILNSLYIYIYIYIYIDPNCMKLCQDNGYPCYNYQHPDAHTHVMEQVADLKLKYVGMALEAGVTVLLLDLDVGFIQDPIMLYEG